MFCGVWILLDGINVIPLMIPHMITAVAIIASAVAIQSSVLFMGLLYHVEE